MKLLLCSFLSPYKHIVSLRLHLAMMEAFSWRTQLTHITMELICMEAELKFVTIRSSTQCVMRGGVIVMLLLSATILAIIIITTVSYCFKYLRQSTVDISQQVVKQLLEENMVFQMKYQYCRVQCVLELSTTSLSVQDLVSTT